MDQEKWYEREVINLFEMPFLELMSQALSTHKANFRLDEMELCSLLSIKTGACPEDCAYCPQSAHYKTSVKRQDLIDVQEVAEHAKIAKSNGAKRLCIGAAWRGLNDRNIAIILEMIRIIKEHDLEACATLGMLSLEQAKLLKNAGLDYYNHNLDTSPEYYQKIISTRTYQERIETLKILDIAGINICCGGIVGMGEERIDRIRLLLQLANLPKQPMSVPINRLIPIAGTPLESQPPIDNIEFVRTIAVARIMMPRSVIRLSAGRNEMNSEMQILCFLAGANSIWLGDKLLTAANSSKDHDQELLKNLGFKK